MCCHNPLLSKQRECSLSAKKEMVPASEEDVIADLMEQHDLFASSMQSRLAKLQVVIVVIEVYRSWISACRQDRKIVYVLYTLILIAFMLKSMGYVYEVFILYLLVLGKFTGICTMFELRLLYMIPNRINYQVDRFCSFTNDTICG